MGKDNRPDIILLAHGGGGRLSRELIAGIIAPRFENLFLRDLSDSAVIPGGSRIAFTTDSYVVQPLFFPGGDIGRLAVCGTVNDLSVCGVEPRFISLSLIIEEGFPVAMLERILDSAAATCLESGVLVVTGDTKVVEKGGLQGIHINTAGIGTVAEGVSLSMSSIAPGDHVILSGTIGDHGIAVIAERNGFTFGDGISSDAAPLNGLIGTFIGPPAGLRFMRDPTRGGISATLNEIVMERAIGIEIDENRIPVNPAVRSAAEILGYDPLSIANEGKVIVIAAEDVSKDVVEAMKGHPLGKKATIIGKITGEHPGKVILRTIAGGKRPVELPLGDQFPRIC